MVIYLETPPFLTETRKVIAGQRRPGMASRQRNQHLALRQGFPGVVSKMLGICDWKWSFGMIT